MRRQLGDPAKSNEDPRWTVDGRRIRLTQVPLLERQPNEAPRDFLLRRRGAERQVLVSIDGSDVQVVAPEQPAPATRDRGLSPDGRWILLSKTVEGVTGLYLREQPSGRETLLDPRPR
jgi:Tol biopolymer transport system component